jgi:hypothetical protein
MGADRDRLDLYCAEPFLSLCQGRWMREQPLQFAEMRQTMSRPGERLDAGL